MLAIQKFYKKGNVTKHHLLICRTIEYMSPEVMDLSHVNPAADMWGVGCITFQLLSGGISPFFANNRYRTMAKVLDCDYSLEQAELSKTSTEAKDFISLLLIKVIKHNKKQESPQINYTVYHNKYIFASFNCRTLKSE